MGKAKIIENLGDARYKIALIYQDGTQAPGEIETYCADFHPDFEVGQEVGTLELNAEPDSWLPTGVFIMPRGEAGLGVLAPAGGMTPAQYFCNAALLPGVQKWRPTYRLGQVVAVDKAANTMSVGIQAAYCRANGLNINRSVEDGATAWASKYDELPNAFGDFKARHPDHPACLSFDPVKAQWSPALWSKIRNGQEEVNTSITYHQDGGPRLESWDLLMSGGQGDCEDYALTKMQRLYDEGVPGGALTICLGDGLGGADRTVLNHAWLEVATTEGTWVLDNNYQEPVRVNRIKYTNRTPVLFDGLGKSGILLSDVPIEYCLEQKTAPSDPDVWLNAASKFDVGREVIVYFKGFDWAQPRVIGFFGTPKSCADPLCILYLDSNGLVAAEGSAMFNRYGYGDGENVFAHYYGMGNDQYKNSTISTVGSERPWEPCGPDGPGTVAVGSGYGSQLALKGTAIYVKVEMSRFIGALSPSTYYEENEVAFVLDIDVGARTVGGEIEPLRVVAHREICSTGIGNGPTLVDNATTYGLAIGPPSAMELFHTRLREGFPGSLGPYYYQWVIGTRADGVSAAGESAKVLEFEISFPPRLVEGAEVYDKMLVTDLRPGGQAVLHNFDSAFLRDTLHLTPEAGIFKARVTTTESCTYIYSPAGDPPPSPYRVIEQKYGHLQATVIMHNTNRPYTDYLP